MEMYRAPLSQILPSCVPVLIERGVSGYNASDLLVSGERRLSESELRSVIVCAAYVGVESVASMQRFNREKVKNALDLSLKKLTDLNSSEQQRVLDLVEAFGSYPIIRANSHFDDWLCESIWGCFQNVPYEYPSAMSGAVAFGLSVIQSFEKCSLEYD